MIIVLIGVSGVGKTTIGRLLVEELGWPFYDRVMRQIKEALGV